MTSPNTSSSTVPLVDCDVHPLVGDMSQLLERMSPRAANRIAGQVGQFARDPNRIPHPSSGLRLDARTPAGGIPGSDAAYAVEQWIDPYDIASAVLIPVQAGSVINWGDVEAGDEFLSALNDHLIEEWYEVDSRLRVTISVSPHDVTAAVAEVDRLADHPSVVGINLPLTNTPLGLPHYDALWAAAVRHDLPIVVHPTGAEGNLSNGPLLAGGQPRTYPERHAMLLLPGQALVSSLIFGGAFERFPSLRFAVTEYGFSWVAALAWRMDEAYERGETGLSEAPSAYVRRNLRFTTQPLDEPGDPRFLRRILDQVDAEHTLMFSSDYPHWDTDDPRLILTTKIPAEIRDRVASLNAQEFFGAKRLGLGDEARVAPVPVARQTA